MSRASNLAGFTTSISPPANLSVGIITASSVINVGTGLTLSSSGINVSGVITATSFSGNGSGLTGVSAGIGTTGSVNTSGIITATSFFGSGSGLTGVGLGTTGSINTSGIITASSFSGNGSGLTGIGGTSVFAAGSAAAPSISPTGDSNTGIFFPSADTVAISEGGAEALRVDSSGRLLVGTSTARSISSNNQFLQVEASGDFNSYLSSFTYNYAGTSGPRIILCKTKGSSAGAVTLVSNGDTLGEIAFNGADGNDVDSTAALIKCEVDGTPGSNDMPGRLVFSTTADGASSSTERMRITSGGRVFINTTDAINPTVANKSFVDFGGAFDSYGMYMQSYNSTTAYFNRQADDGTVIEIRQAGSLEGSISVSGTTVSYNGAHLSRWSQLPSGAIRIEILRGTVLSNLDEMCEWIDEPKEAVLWQEGEELPEGINVGDIKEPAVESGLQENEQLNRMKVSEVEGDKNVSGVFQCWDDDDDTYTNDFYCAMTGDFIIRIADGVTVERGDLLMSAGDGTAKPQDDDIIRSKTVAKVTSTNVTCTYEDGSYCVPCVLMAC